MKKTWIILGILGLLVLNVIWWGISQYNRPIRMKESVDAQWAQVENQLKRRYDLIPNLVETVKGYAAQEKTVFLGVAEARKAYFQAQSVDEKARAATGLEGALSRLLLLQERYPALKSSENFLKLQDSLEGTENRISVERKRYNDEVKALNTFVKTFPGRFFASMAGIGEAPYFDIPEAQKETPAVKF
ncbi:MAG TPA: LemA family protein [Deltaproteobacteria bacterium]|nr:LemA family protein [Deltaproteobacteria bacterium]HOI06358.1 LemA family protein [Deltaproteobacteria bacterium]